MLWIWCFFVTELQKQYKIRADICAIEKAVGKPQRKLRKSMLINQVVWNMSGVVWHSYNICIACVCRRIWRQLWSVALCSVTFCNSTLTKWRDNYLSRVPFFFGDADGFSICQDPSRPPFHGTRKFTTGLTACHLPIILSQINPFHPLPSYFIACFISSHLSLGLLRGLFPSCFPIKALYAPLLPCTCPVRLIVLGLVTRIMYGEGQMEWLQDPWAQVHTCHSQSS